MSGGQVTTYDLRNVIITFGPVWLQGFAPGDALNTEFDDERETAQAGGDGDVVRTISGSKLATATVRLQRGSQAAKQLIALKQASLPGQTYPFVITDLANNLLHTSMQAWLVGDGPPPNFGAEAPVEEWVFKLASFDVNKPLLSVTG